MRVSGVEQGRGAAIYQSSWCRCLVLAEAWHAPRPENGPARQPHCRQARMNFAACMPVCQPKSEVNKHAKGCCNLQMQRDTMLD